MRLQYGYHFKGEQKRKSNKINVAISKGNKTHKSKI